MSRTNKTVLKTVLCHLIFGLTHFTLGTASVQAVTANDFLWIWCTRLMIRQLRFSWIMVWFRWWLGARKGTSHYLTKRRPISATQISRVSCQKGPTRHAYAWQIGPFRQDILDMCRQVKKSDDLISYCRRRLSVVLDICQLSIEKNIYSHFESYFGFGLTQVYEIISGTTTQVVCPTQQIPCLLML